MVHNDTSEHQYEISPELIDVAIAALSKRGFIPRNEMGDEIWPDYLMREFVRDILTEILPAVPTQQSGAV